MPGTGASPQHPGGRVLQAWEDTTSAKESNSVPRSGGRRAEPRTHNTPLVIHVKARRQQGAQMLPIDLRHACASREYRARLSEGAKC